VVGTTFESVHGCDPADAVDATCLPEVTVGFGYDGSNFYYDPKCVVVSKGTTVTFESEDGFNFTHHPLEGGEVKQGGFEADPNSPIPYTFGTHTTASFEFDEVGTWPYYCVAHVSVQMYGVVYVDGEP